MMVKSMPGMFLLLFLAACGVSSDNLNSTTYEKISTQYNLDNVIAGNVYSGVQGDKVVMDTRSADVYNSGNFYFKDVPTVTASIGIPLKAVLMNGSDLWSYFQGTPVPKASITLIEHYDWHNFTGTYLYVQTAYYQPLLPEASVSINPFTNLAYWLNTGNSYAGFQNNLKDLNDKFFANAVSPDCQADKWLCKEHLSFFTSGNSISVSTDGLSFSFKTPGFAVCNGLISAFPAPCFKEFSSVRHKRL